MLLTVSLISSYCLQILEQKSRCLASYKFEQARIGTLLKMVKVDEHCCFPSPSVQLAVLFHLEDDDPVSQPLGSVTQVFVQLASTQTKHGQRHRDAY